VRSRTLTPSSWHAAALHLRPTRYRRPGYGSLQKVVVIQALLGEPALVVLDEPSAGLDA
jgi:ABC-type multidrug transport system ATPase subunit